MYARWIVLAALSLTGCAPMAAPVAPVGPATQAAVVVPKDRILVKFQTLSCVCSLGDIEYALLDLPEVSALDWDVADNRVWLIFLDERRPTDDAIRECVRYSPVRIKEIIRP